MEEKYEKLVDAILQQAIKDYMVYYNKLGNVSKRDKAKWIRKIDEIEEFFDSQYYKDITNCCDGKRTLNLIKTEYGIIYDSKGILTESRNIKHFDKRKARRT